MRLLRLSANKDSFKAVPFNPVGLSIIVGKRHNNDYTANKKNTYNSVGKSLTIALVHFCLGSTKNAEFEIKLNDWEFTLDFEIEGVEYSAVRKCNDQKKVFLNGKENTLEEYKDFLADKVFGLTKDTKYISFRGLISRFVRPNKKSYVSYDEFIDKEQDFQKLLNNSYLLGLDTNLIQKKHSLKEELDTIEQAKSNAENEPIMRAFFQGEKKEDFEIDIVDLKDKIQKLEKNLSEFRVAEDYYEIVKEADILKIEVKQLENKAVTFKTAISSIEKSLNIAPDIPANRVIQLYSEAQITLPDVALRELKDLEEFNKKLLTNRSGRLVSEKKRLEDQLTAVEKAIESKGREKDQKLEYLNTRGALDEFTKLNEQLKDFKTRFEKLDTYKKLLSEYKNKLEELKKDFSTQNIATNKYLEDNSLLVEKNILIFKSVASQFYENKRAGIDIRNNDGQNKQRFEIKAKIDDDKGDGVNDVKIFCFDWTLLRGGHNHKIKFLFHDSRLLSEIDSRQVATLFEIAFTATIENDLQYIISCNQNTLDSLKQELSEEDYKTIIEDNIVLELTDESEESKLLGIQLDLDYDKE